MSEEIKALFPEGVETLTISKDDYDRLYGQLTYENIILQQKVEQLEEEKFQLKMEWILVKSELDTSEERLEQLENIRKEAIESIENGKYTVFKKDIETIYEQANNEFLNILNKGSE